MASIGIAPRYNGDVTPAGEKFFEILRKTSDAAETVSTMGPRSYLLAMTASFTDVPPAERLKAFLLIARGMANFTSQIDLLKLQGNLSKCGTFHAVLGGGLEPHFRVLFSAIFHGVPSEIAIRVENRGFLRKQNCCKLLQVYVYFICVLCFIKIARPISVRSWSRSPVIMATRKSPEHRERSA